MCCTTDKSGFDSRQEQEVFLSFITFSPSLGPTQPPTQWLTEALSLGLKREGRETDSSPPSSAEVKNGGAIPPLPHGVLLN
jgi:hypothetical protein